MNYSIEFTSSRMLSLPNLNSYTSNTDIINTVALRMLNNRSSHKMSLSNQADYGGLLLVYRNIHYTGSGISFAVSRTFFSFAMGESYAILHFQGYIHQYFIIS